MTIEFHVWTENLRETTTFIRSFFQAKSTQEQKQTKARRKLPSKESWPSPGKKKKTDLEILTSPKGGLHRKYLWKILEKPQIDERLKERKKEEKKPNLKNYTFYEYRTI